LLLSESNKGSWSQRFDDPIVLPDGAKLATLGDAASHLSKTIPSAGSG
jgi:hypothetical protein